MIHDVPSCTEVPRADPPALPPGVALRAGVYAEAHRVADAARARPGDAAVPPALAAAVRRFLEVSKELRSLLREDVR